jgi:NAD(P)-dependent dehydrogenase (short-subunit alcohol dehydrogenase family)
MSFEGRRAIVTGAASGIGKAVALHLLGEGALVTAVDVNEAGLEDARAAGAETLATDLSDESGRAAVVAAAEAHPTHYLVNAAGILGLKPIWDVTQADFRRIFAVNLESAWFLCRDVGRQLVEGGAIVNFSSPSARWAYTLETAPYRSRRRRGRSPSRTRRARYGSTRSRPASPTPRCRRPCFARRRRSAARATRS